VKDRQAENVRKMLLGHGFGCARGAHQNGRPAAHMRTLEHLKPDRQEAIARETQDIYAPLAHRLGMGKVRGN